MELAFYLRRQAVDIQMTKTYSMLESSNFYKKKTGKNSEFTVSEKMVKKGLEKVIFKDRSGIQIHVN